MHVQFRIARRLLSLLLVFTLVAGSAPIQRVSAAEVEPETTAQPQTHSLGDYQITFTRGDFPAEAEVREGASDVAFDISVTARHTPLENNQEPEEDGEEPDEEPGEPEEPGLPEDPEEPENPEDPPADDEPGQDPGETPPSAEPPAEAPPVEVPAVEVPPVEAPPADENPVDPVDPLASLDTVLQNLGQSLGLVPIPAFAAELAQTIQTIEDDYIVDDEPNNLGVLELYWYLDGVRQSHKATPTITIDDMGYPITVGLEFAEVAEEDDGVWTLRVYDGNSFVESPELTLTVLTGPEQPVIEVLSEQETFSVGQPFGFSVTSSLSGLLSITLNDYPAMVIDSAWIAGGEEPEPFEVLVYEMPEVEEANFVITVRPESADFSNPAVSAMLIYTVLWDGEKTLLSIEADSVFLVGEPLDIKVLSFYGEAGELELLLDTVDEEETIVSEQLFAGEMDAFGVYETQIEEMPDVAEAVLTAVLSVDGEEVARAVRILKLAVPMMAMNSLTNWQWDNMTFNAISHEPQGDDGVVITFGANNTGSVESWRERGGFYHQVLDANSNFRISGNVTVNGAVTGAGFSNPNQMTAGFIARTGAAQATNSGPAVRTGMYFSGFNPATQDVPNIGADGITRVNTSTSRLRGVADVAAGRMGEIPFLAFDRPYFVEMVRVDDSYYTFIDGELTAYRNTPEIFKNGQTDFGADGIREADPDLRVGMFASRGLNTTFDSVVLEKLESSDLPTAINVSTLTGETHSFVVAQNDATNLSDVTFTAVTPSGNISFTADEAAFLVNSVRRDHDALPTAELGVQTATVSFRGYQQDFTYLVILDTIVGMELLSPPLQTVYQLNENGPNLLGLSVQLTWQSGRVTRNNATDANFSTLLQITGFSSAAANPALTITVRPAGETTPSASFPVEIKDMAITSLEVENWPNLVFFAGHDVPSTLPELLAGLVVRATFDDGPENPTVRILTAGDVSATAFGSAPFTGSWAAGEHVLDVGYGGESFPVTFTVHPVNFIEMYVETYPDKTTYTHGTNDSPDFTGMTVRAVRNDGSMSDVLTQGTHYDLMWPVPFNINVNIPDDELAVLFEVHVEGRGTYAELDPYVFYVSVIRNVDYTTTWRWRVFGESASTANNPAPVFEGSETVSSGNAAAVRNISKLDENSVFTLTTRADGGKVQDNAVDGLNFVYQKLPLHANYRLEATIEVESLGRSDQAYATHQQQSFGIMMRETVDPHGDTATKTLSNFWMFGPLGSQGYDNSPNSRGREHNIGPRIRNMDDPRWQTSSFYPPPIWGNDGDPTGRQIPHANYFTWRPWYNPNATDKTIMSPPDPDPDTFPANNPGISPNGGGPLPQKPPTELEWYAHNGFYHVKDYNTMDVVFERQNNNFSGSAEAGPAGNKQTLTWDRTDDTDFQYTLGGHERNLGTTQNPNWEDPTDDYIYVGFFTARNAVIKVSNVKFTVTDGRAEKPGGVVRRDPVVPRVQFNSPEQVSAGTGSNTTDYELKFASSASGTAIVSYNNRQIASMAVLANQQVSVEQEVTRGELNNFAVQLFPTPGGNFTSFDTVNAFLNVTFASLDSGDIFVHPAGTARSAGTRDEPTTLADAITRIAPGNTIQMLPGRYIGAINIANMNNGSASEGYKRINAIEGGVFVGPQTISGDDANPTITRSPAVNVLNGNFWHLKGIIFEGRMTIGGSNNVVEMSTFRNGQESGVWISAAGGVGGLASGDRSVWPANNILLNVESYGHQDPTNMNADGFAVKISVGEGNRLIGTVAHHNVDDGYDLFAKNAPIGEVSIEYAIAYRSGQLMDQPTNTGADGQGFKLGGSGIGVLHRLSNSISFENKASGVTSNSNPWSIVQDSVFFDNRGANINLTGSGTTRRDHRVENVFSYRKNVTGGNDGIQTMTAQGGISTSQTDARKVWEGGEPHSIYLWNGNLATGASTNDLGRRVTDDFFESVDTPGGSIQNVVGQRRPYHFPRDPQVTNSVSVGNSDFSDDIERGGFLVLTPFAYAHRNVDNDLTHEVTFDPNGGDLPSDELKRVVNSGEFIGELPEPTRLYHVLVGWFTAAEDGEEVTEETRISEDVTFYAVWRYDIPQLDAPVITLGTGADAHLITWDAVPESDHYQVLVDDDPVEHGSGNKIEGTSFDLTTLDLETGEYEISLIAVGDGILFDSSEPSNVVVWKVVGELPKLDAPQILRGTGENANIITWSAVANASFYRVVLDDEPTEHGLGSQIEGTSFDLTTLDLDDGTYEIRLIAVGDGIAFESSEPSNVVAWVVAGALPRLSTPEIKLEGNMLSWEDISGAVRYNVEVDGDMLDDPSPGADATSPFDLTTLNLPVGEYDITLVAVADHTTHRNSEPSNVVSFEVRSGEPQRLTAPTLVPGSGGSAHQITWTAITGATGYRVFVNDVARPVGSVGHNIPAAATSFSLLDLGLQTAGNYNITLVALGNSTTTLDSAQSNVVVWTVTQTGPEQLPPPTLAQGTGENAHMITWSRITGAIGYRVTVNGNERPDIPYGHNIAEDVTSLNLRMLGLGVGNYEIRLIALGNGNTYSTSQPSNFVSWEVSSPPPERLPAPVINQGTGANAHIITWPEVAGAVRYNVAVGATMVTAPSPGYNATSPFDLRTLRLAIGTHTITLLAIGDGETGLTSLPSNEIRFTVAAIVPPPPPMPLPPQTQGPSLPPVHVPGTPESNVASSVNTAASVVRSITSNITNNPSIGNSTTAESLLTAIQSGLPVGATATWSANSPLVVIPATTTSTGSITGVLIIGSGANRTAIIVNIVIPMLTEEPDAEAAPPLPEVVASTEQEPRTLVLGLDSYEIRDVSGARPPMLMDVLPIIQSGYTLLPVRYVAEALGVDVSWNELAREVTLASGNSSITFAIGETVPGMDVPSQIVDNRTMVPLRFISEFFGADINWDEETRSIEITI